MAGNVKGYLLPQCALNFNSNIGKYNLPIGALSVSDFETTDGRRCPRVSSALGRHSG
jgi:hypothetical protein